MEFAQARFWMGDLPQQRCGGKIHLHLASGPFQIKGHRFGEGADLVQVLAVRRKTGLLEFPAGVMMKRLLNEKIEGERNKEATGEHEQGGKQGMPPGFAGELQDDEMREVE